MNHFFITAVLHPILGFTNCKVEPLAKVVFSVPVLVSYPDMCIYLTIFNLSTLLCSTVIGAGCVWWSFKVRYFFSENSRKQCQKE